MRPSGHITIAAVGKLRRSHWQAAQDDYLQRLQRYTTVELVEVRDVAGRSIPDAVAMQREGKQLLKAAASAGRKIALTPDGKLMSSPQLATYLRRQIEVYGRIAFLIGGPLGFAPEVTRAAHTQLALSYLSFPHELARVILLEQLDRAFTILNHEPYHK